MGAGKLALQIIEPVQGHPLRLLLRRELGTGLADMGCVALSGKFLIGLIFAADLAVVPVFFHTQSFSPSPDGTAFLFIAALWPIGRRLSTASCGPVQLVFIRDF